MGAQSQRAAEPDSADRIFTVTESTFDSLVLESEGPIAVEFMSYGCEHCGRLEPVLQRVAEMVAPREKIYRVNTATDQELANRYGVQGTPTLVMFLNGQAVGEVEGPRPTISSVLTAVAQPFRVPG